MSNETKPVTWQTEGEAKEIYAIRKAVDKLLGEDLESTDSLMIAIHGTLLSILDLLQKRLPPREQPCRCKPDDE